MVFIFAEYFSVKIAEKSGVFRTLADELQEYFRERNYGDCVQSLYVGLKCVEDVYKPFFQARDPKYTRKKTATQGKNSLSYDIELNYKKVLIASDDEIRKLVLTELINSIDTLQNIRGIKDFDVAKLKQDLQLFNE